LCNYDLINWQIEVLELRKEAELGRLREKLLKAEAECKKSAERMRE
jgi:hypothetical protein